MDFQASVPLWDLSSSYGPAVSDDDFLAMLQKDYSAAAPSPAPPPPLDGVSPQQLAVAGPGSSTPPLTDDSSPSPPSSALDPPQGRHSRRVSLAVPSDGSERDAGDDRLKRKASGADLDGGARKAAYSDADSPLPAKAPSKRPGQKDEVRQLRRKEQNRAAQRAFRERKEKHVHDLEGRVAELEAAQRAKDVENENLRDLLARLQDENRVLKDAAFTFSMPPPPPPPPLHHHASSSSSSSASMYSAAPPATPQLVQNSPPAAQPDIDWASLTTFDPAALNMLDADINMMDFSAPEPTDVGSPYRTIASNPMFMSFADFSPPTRQNSGSSAVPQWDTSFSSLGAWPGAPPSRQPSDFEQLLGLPAPPMDFVASPQSLSPVMHGSRLTPAPAPVQSPQRTALPDLGGVAHPFQFAPGAHSGVASPPAPENGENPTQCPRTRADFAARIARELSSPFAAGGAPAPAVPALGTGMGCEGAGFPKTERSEANIEVLAAWRRITSDPQFQHVDINELCAEFTNKAKCDGTRVVLDPAGVSQIISKFTAAAR